MKQPAVVPASLARSNGVTGFTRRRLLQTISAGLCALRADFLFRDWAFPQLNETNLPVEEQARVLFEEVSGSQSGISWRHVNGRSPEYLSARDLQAPVAPFSIMTMMAGWIFISSTVETATSIPLVLRSGRCALPQ
jgi:hypothetical protein